MINPTIRAMITTSQEQGQTREGMSGGSWRQSCELTDRNVIEGRDLWDELAQHNEILPPVKNLEIQTAAFGNHSWRH